MPGKMMTDEEIAQIRYLRDNPPPKPERPPVDPATRHKRIVAMVAPYQYAWMLAEAQLRYEKMSRRRKRGRIIKLTPTGRKRFAKRIKREPTNKLGRAGQYSAIIREALDLLIELYAQKEFLATRAGKPNPRAEAIRSRMAKQAAARPDNNVERATSPTPAQIESREPASRSQEYAALDLQSSESTWRSE